MLQQRGLHDQYTASQTKVEKSVFIMNKSLWKNKLNFVKDTPMVYVNFITAILVSEKK